MSYRFRHATGAQISPSLPRGHMCVTVTCPRCNAEHGKRILLRRVRRHIEELKSPVRVIIHTRCPDCACTLVSRVRISMTSHHPGDVHTEVI